MIWHYLIINPDCWCRSQQTRCTSQLLEIGLVYAALIVLHKLKIFDEVPGSSNQQVGAKCNWSLACNTQQNGNKSNRVNGGGCRLPQKQTSREPWVLQPLHHSSLFSLQLSLWASIVRSTEICRFLHQWWWESLWLVPVYTGPLPQGLGKAWNSATDCQARKCHMDFIWKLLEHIGIVEHIGSCSSTTIPRPPKNQKQNKKRNKKMDSKASEGLQL